MKQLKQVTNSVFDFFVEEAEGHISIIKLKDKLVFVDSGTDPIIAHKARNEAEKLTSLSTEKLILTINS